MPRQVLCEGCGKEYFYILKCTAVGQGFSTFFLENAAAEQEAEAKAREKLEQQLAFGCDLVPCPGCLRYQKDMVAYARRTRWKWMTISGLLLLLFSFAMGLAGAGITGPKQGDLSPSEERSLIVVWSIMALSFGTGIGLMVVRFFRCRRYDPNSEPERIRKDQARRRALTREQLEHLLRSQERRKPKKS
jgi:hypothetical protein